MRSLHLPRGATGASEGTPEATEESASQPASAGEQGQDEGGAGSVEPSAGDIPELEDILCAAISAQLEDDGWALLSNVGFQLVANHPTFDSRNYGFPRLGVLVRDQSFTEVREVETAGGNKVLHVRLAG